MDPEVVPPGLVPSRYVSHLALAPVPNVLEARLRVLAVGIRPTFGVECGMSPTGSVDLLDASGIIGWRLGIQELVTAADAAPSPSSRRLGAWARAELDADEERWRYLEAFAIMLMQAAAGAGLPGISDEGFDEGEAFSRGWVRNLRHALDLLVSSRLHVSRAAVTGLREAKAAFSGLRHDAEALPGILAQLVQEAMVRVSDATGHPPPLVLPEYREALTAALERADD